MGRGACLAVSSRPTGYIKAEKAELSYLVDSNDDKLFDSILSNSNHIVYSAYYRTARHHNLTHNLRPRRHDRIPSRVLLIRLTQILSPGNYLRIVNLLGLTL